MIGKHRDIQTRDPSSIPVLRLVILFEPSAELIIVTPYLGVR